MICFQTAEINLPTLITVAYRTFPISACHYPDLTLTPALSCSARAQNRFLTVLDCIFTYVITEYRRWHYLQVSAFVSFAPNLRKMSLLAFLSPLPYFLSRNLKLRSAPGPHRLAEDKLRVGKDRMRVAEGVK